MFILDEIDVGGSKLVENYIRVGNIRANIPKDHPRVLKKVPKVGAQDNRCLVGQSMPLLVVSL